MVYFAGKNKIFYKDKKRPALHRSYGALQCAVPCMGTTLIISYLNSCVI